MESNRQHLKLESSQVGTARILAAGFMVAAIGIALFSNSAATARQANPLSGSGEVLRAPLAAPAAGQTAGDPSLPDAAEALRGQRSERVSVVAPTF